MPKRRSTIPIAHADDVPTIAFTDEQWQAIEHAYGRQLDADLRQQITTVTTQYLKDWAFERTAAPKAMAWERIERIRRAAGDLERAMLDSKPFSASTDELSREQQDELSREQQDELSRKQQEQQEQQQSAHSYADGLIRRHLDERRSSKARGRLKHFRNTLKSLVIACDCALNDLSAAEGLKAGILAEIRAHEPARPARERAWTQVLAEIRAREDAWRKRPGQDGEKTSGDGQAWDWWIQALTQIVQRHDLPYGARIVETSREPSPFVALVRALQLLRALQEHVPARHMHSDEALAKAIQRAQRRARDK
jgi:hypothetical protein